MSSESTSEPEPTSQGYLSCCGCTESASLPYALDLFQLGESVTVLREALDHIESMSFAVHTGLASGISVFRCALEDDHQVQKLIELCRDSREVAVFVLGHMLLLTTRKFDEKYTNPYDHAVAAYLHVLVTSRTDLTSTAVNTAKRLKNANWPARYIANYLS